MEFNWGLKRRAIFKPKNLETLRPEMFEFIGQEWIVEFGGGANDDEPFPGQYRWHLPEDVYKKCGRFWAPNEDFEFLDEV